MRSLSSARSELIEALVAERESDVGGITADEAANCSKSRLRTESGGLRKVITSTSHA
jgi:hypothetical protein